MNYQHIEDYRNYPIVVRRAHYKSCFLFDDGKIKYETDVEFELVDVSYAVIKLNVSASSTIIKKFNISQLVKKKFTPSLFIKTKYSIKNELLCFL